MRALLTAVLLFASLLGLPAQRNNLKPTDFEPLTSLPWNDVFATPESVLKAIFKEPNPAIRYPVLGEYLRLIPVEQLGKALDLAAVLEGTQQPDDLVDFILGIWMQRDPRSGWRKTRELFSLLGPVDGDWLGYDDWRTKITVPDIESVRTSPFWLTTNALTSAPYWLELSTLPREEKVAMMQDFAQMWIRTLATWPASGGPGRGYAEHTVFSPQLALAFEARPELRNLTAESGWQLGGLPFEIELRRWVKQNPSLGLKIITMAREHNASLKNAPLSAYVRLDELFMLWAKADLPAMLRWVETLDPRKDDDGMEARAYLMHFVDAATRERWLATLKAEKPEEDLAIVLLEKWAQWDPKPALDTAVATGDAELIRDVAVEGAYGLRNGTWNSCHHGLGVIKDFDVAALPEKLRRAVIHEWGVTIMEQWLDVDVAEAARYGLDFMLRNQYEPRENLLRFFAGDPAFRHDSDMVDRTFCALRGWAVLRPKEMQAWIATQQGEDMRKALTWLLEHPWGGPEKQK